VIKINIRKNWIQGISSQYYSVENTIEDVKSNFDVRRYYSAEGSSVEIDGVVTQVIIQSHSNPLNQGKYDRKIHMPIETVVRTGSLVEWENNIWLITSNIDDLQSYKSASMVECNNTLKFYSPITSTLYSIPCIITNKLTLSEDENKYLTTVDNQFYLIVSSSATTLQIKPDDVFKLGVYNYKISTVCDDISVPGLLVFKVVFSEIEQSLPTYTIEILNGTLLRADVNTPLQLNIRVNVTIDGITTIASPNPSLIFNSSNDNICTVDENGLCTFYQVSEPSWDLDAIIDDEMILDLDKTYELTDDCKFLLNDLFGVEAIPGVIISVKLASDESVIGYANIDVYETEQDNYTVEISGSISIVKTKTSNYSCVFKNNGVAITDNSVFYLTADDGVSSTTLATISSQNGVGNSCVIIAGSNLGYVKLWVKNDDNTIVSSGFRIQIKSLF